jgi:hypothetical protein
LETVAEMTNNEEFQEITSRLYRVISQPAGERDWESIRGLYHPRATMVRTGIGDDGKPFVRAMTFDEYVDNASALLEGIRFSEVEVSQEATVFGNVARLASVYEFEYRFPDDEVRRGRGVTFFNLVNEGQGWKVMNIVWDNERDGLSLDDAGVLPGAD